MTQGKVVSLQYVLREGDGQGEIIESTTEKLPAKFVLGVGGLLPDFENKIIDLEKGDTFEFILQHDKAYGHYDEQAVVDLPKNTFIHEGKLLSQLLEIGNVIPMSDQNGSMINGKVLEISDETVKMDFNHPLAGLNLHFKGSILDTRLATPEEMEHGHVHDEGCC
ncbi:MAG TPA: FKBP-type peptidyl-prolyl cis-trans isomerase [Bacteroidales bacterium]|nr:FKBP-type peptidyl-prolyl cis-trans isomerase [Bacteroidales bacterium]